VILIKSHFSLKLVSSLKLVFSILRKVFNKFHLLQYFFYCYSDNTVFSFLGQNLSSMVGYHKCFAMHPDDQNPNGNFSVLNKLGIASSALHITLYHILMYSEIK